MGGWAVLILRSELNQLDLGYSGMKAPGRMISGKPIFLTMAVERSTKCGYSFLTWVRSPGSSFRVTNSPDETRSTQTHAGD